MRAPGIYVQQCNRQPTVDCHQGLSPSPLSHSLDGAPVHGILLTSSQVCASLLALKELLYYWSYHSLLSKFPWPGQIATIGFLNQLQTRICMLSGIGVYALPSPIDQTATPQQNDKHISSSCFLLLLTTNSLFVPQCLLQSSLDIRFKRDLNTLRGVPPLSFSVLSKWQMHDIDKRVMQAWPFHYVRETNSTNAAADFVVFHRRDGDGEPSCTCV